MIFEGKARVVHNVTGPDPVTNPQDVEDEQIAQTPRRRPYSDIAPAQVFLALDSPIAGETCTVEVWALDESTTPADPGARTPATQAARRFYLLVAGLVLTNKHATPLVPPSAGPLYIRRTADAMATEGTVHVGIV